MHTHRIKSMSAIILLLLVRSIFGQDDDRMDWLRKADRIVFLGDSITYSGQYVAFFEVWLWSRQLPKSPLVVNVGLPSETVSGLSEDGHAGGEFPRPDLAERLDRVLAVTKPDLVFACYGINCGIYRPLDDGRFQRYQEGMRHLKQKVEAAGATLIVVTPPFYDDQQAKTAFAYNAVLDRYTQWLLDRRKEGWLVIDVHGPMTDEVNKRRQTDPSFVFQPDAVHPHAAGHWFMTQQLIRWFDDASEADAESPQKMVENCGMPSSSLELFERRMSVLRDAYLTAAGHKRPGIPAGKSIREAQQEAGQLLIQIRSASK